MDDAAIERAIGRIVLAAAGLDVQRAVMLMLFNAGLEGSLSETLGLASDRVYRDLRGHAREVAKRDPDLGNELMGWNDRGYRALRRRHVLVHSAAFGGLGTTTDLVNFKADEIWPLEPKEFENLARELAECAAVSASRLLGAAFRSLGLDPSSPPS